MPRRSSITIFLLSAVLAGACTKSPSRVLHLNTPDAVRFRTIYVHGPFQVNIRKGDSTTIKRVDGGRDAMKQVSVSVADSTLSIVMTNKSYLDTPIGGIEFDLTTADFDRIKIRGSARVNVLSMMEGTLDLSIVGQGTVHVDRLDLVRMRADILGRGEITAEGRIEDLSVDIKNGGRFSGNGLLTGVGAVKISNGGLVLVNVEDQLKAIMGDHTWGLIEQ